MTDVTWTELQTAEPESRFDISTFAPESATRAGWKTIEDRLLVLRRLEDDWDGMGASAPEPEVVDSVLRFLTQLRASGIPAPQRAVAGPNGEIGIEWQLHGIVLQAEVEEPGKATWTEKEPGKRAVFWKEDFQKNNRDELWEALPTIEILGPDSVAA